MALTRGQEAQNFTQVDADQSLLASAATILKHALNVQPVGTSYEASSARAQTNAPLQGTATR